MTQRVARSVSFIAEKNPALIEPYLETMLLRLQQPAHDTLPHKVTHTLRDLRDIPDNILGLTADAAYWYFGRPPQLNNAFQFQSGAVKSKKAIPHSTNA